MQCTFLLANTGKLAENLVLLAHQRRTQEIYYYTSPAELEVDFYLPETHELIQVSQNLAQPATREREVRALTDGLRGLGLTHRLILTDATAEPILESGLTIEVRSLAEWLLLP